MEMGPQGRDESGVGKMVGERERRTCININHVLIELIGSSNSSRAAEFQRLFSISFHLLSIYVSLRCGSI
jgi:hypothetical protein